MPSIYKWSIPNNNKISWEWEWNRPGLTLVWDGGGGRGAPVLMALVTPLAAFNVVTKSSCLERQFAVALFYRKSTEKKKHMKENLKLWLSGGFPKEESCYKRHRLPAHSGYNTDCHQAYMYFIQHVQCHKQWQELLTGHRRCPLYDLSVLRVFNFNF